MSDKEELSSEQVRAARALLRWDQRHLAEASGVSLPSIKRLELQPGRLAAHASTTAAIRAAFEAAGVEFIGGKAPGVRLRFVEVVAAKGPDGAWYVKARWRQGDPVELVKPKAARKAANEAERRGDARLANALREAADKADRFA